jgi:hypothetical protein
LHRLFPHDLINLNQNKNESSTSEFAGYWQTTDFLKNLSKEEQPIKFYDSVTGNLLFEAPKGRTMDEFLVESQSHGWPSFRDEEVHWEYVRCLKDGECVSTTGVSAKGECSQFLLFLLVLLCFV